MGTPENTAVSLQPVTEANWRQSLTLAVLPEQQRFVSEVTPIAALMMAKAYVRPGGATWKPFIVYRGAEQAGMLQLVHRTEPARVCYLRHFFIDSRFQGQSLGKAALDAFIAMVRADFPDCESIELTVHPENEVAQRLYRQAGFVPTGQVLDGEPVYALAMLGEG